MIKWHRARFSAEEPTLDWYAEDRHVILARAANTSHTGTEDYPWEWYLTPTGTARAKEIWKNRVAMGLSGKSREPKDYGQQDTLRGVKQTVAYLLGESAS